MTFGVFGVFLSQICHMMGFECLILYNLLTLFPNYTEKRAVLDLFRMELGVIESW
jgi:hypothetical protein